MKNILYSLLLSLVLVSCDKSYEKLTPSGLERNWLVIEDEGTTQMDTLCYKIFKETGVPIYYNDTIGSQERVSSFGEVYTYYERLQVFYSPGDGTVTENTWKFDLIEKTKSDELLPITQFIYDEVLPNIPKNIYVPSILLTTELNAPSDTIVHKGLNTIAIGETLLFDKQDGIDKRTLKGKILRSIVSGHLLNSEAKWLEENFYALTYAVNPKAPSGIYSYGKTTIFVSKAWDKFLPEVTEPKLYPLGLIVRHIKTPPTAPEKNWYTPTKVQDVNSFCEKLFSHTTQEIESEYVGHKVILDKFDVMREKLIELGFTFN